MSKLIYTGLNAGKFDVKKVVGGEGVYFHLEDGRKVLDGSNTGGPLGHLHPRMVEAMQDAAGRCPVVNEGWFWAEREKAAEELIAIGFKGDEDWVGGVRFFLSGSEANDLALSFAQAYTGRTPLATRERAFHGMTGLSTHMTVQPHWHGGISRADGNSSPIPSIVEVRTLPAPRYSHYGEYDRTPVSEYLAGAADTLDGVAATIIDYTQGGKYYDADYQDAVATAAREAGSLWIADEVVTGLGRHGSSMLAFQGGKCRPDIVTLGKPIAGGSMPGGAVVLSKDIVDDMSDKSWQTYSTFRGHPLQVAAIRAYLQVLESENLLSRVRELEVVMKRRLVEIAEKHPSVRRVDGHGLHWTVELYGPDWRDWQIATTETPVASQVTNKALELGAMLGTSGEQTSLFLAPPLVITNTELERLLSILDDSLLFADDLFDIAQSNEPRRQA